LERFWLSEWLPLKPGLFHEPHARFAREKAERFTLAGSGADRHEIESFERGLGMRISPEISSRLRALEVADGQVIDRADVVHVYLPSGKVSMLKGGIGCIRLRDKRVGGDTAWFMGASSTPIAHEGMVVALPVEQYARVIEDVTRHGALRCTLMGRLAYVPAELNALYRDVVGIPQMYLHVEEIAHEVAPYDENFLATGAVLVRTDDIAAEHRARSPWDLAPGIGAAYVTFQPSRPSSIEHATEWLAETYVRGVMRGTVATDFDETITWFPNTEFALDAVMRGHVSATAAAGLVARCGGSEHQKEMFVNQLVINGGLVVGGDQYNIGQAAAAGPGARADNVVLNQGSSTMVAVSDPAALAGELERLCAHLGAGAQTPEQEAALEILAQAELTAKDGDADAAVEKLSTLKRLGDAGRWALGAATAIGTTVAAAALKVALGL
jgi:hypothetical protein